MWLKDSQKKAKIFKRKNFLFWWRRSEAEPLAR